MNQETHRAEFIQGLRDLAAFLETHPTVSAPRYTTLNVFLDKREDVVTHARAASWEKVYNENWFYLRRNFPGEIAYEINTSRETVCRKLVTGTRVVPAQPETTVEEVEWVCEERSLLAEAVE